MPSKLKRLALTPDPKLDAVLAKLSRLQRRPKAAIAAELLLEMTPALERIAGLLEVAMENRSQLSLITGARLDALGDLMSATATFGLDRLEDTVSPKTGTRAARPGLKRRRH